MGDRRSDSHASAEKKNSVVAHAVARGPNELVPCSLWDIQQAARSASLSAAAQGIAPAGCGTAAMLQAAAVQAQRLCKEEDPLPSADDDPLLEAIPPPPTPCPPPQKAEPLAPSPAASLAEAAGKEAKDVAEKYKQAQMDTKKALEKAKLAKKKVGMMKRIIARAYEKAANEAEKLAKAKMELAAAIPASAISGCKPKTTNLDTAKAEEAAALKKQKELTTAAKSVEKNPDKTASGAQAAMDAAKKIAKDANQLLFELDSSSISSCN